MKPIIVERPGEGLVLMAVYKDFDTVRQLWGLGHTGGRKAHTCVMCKETINKGEKAYRPFGFPFNRYARACLKCVEVPVAGN